MIMATPVPTVQVERLIISFLLALPIGWDREMEERSAGVRTFPLVSLGSCGLMLISNVLGGGSPDVNSRVLQGLVTGIGFVGGGAILKSEKTVRGTATAASIWNMAVVGTATALGLYGIAGILVLINFVSLRLLLPLKRDLDRR
jgi:putative Mg2+ transporter-C (MgtC) family protein